MRSKRWQEWRCLYNKLDKSLNFPRYTCVVCGWRTTGGACFDGHSTVRAKKFREPSDRQNDKKHSMGHISEWKQRGRDGRLPLLTDSLRLLRHLDW